MAKWDKDRVLAVLFIAGAILVACLGAYLNFIKEEKARQEDMASWDRVDKMVSEPGFQFSQLSPEGQTILLSRARHKADMEEARRNPWIGWVILGGPVALIVGGVFLVNFQKKRGLLSRRLGGKVSASPFWSCPKCSAVLRKAGLGVVWFSGGDLSKVRGTATCGTCGATYPQAEVYGGSYDMIPVEKF